MDFQDFELESQYLSSRLGQVKIYAFKPSLAPMTPETVQTSQWIEQYSADLKILLVEGKYDNMKRFQTAAESLKLRAEIKHQNITPLLCFQRHLSLHTLYAAYQNTENSLNVRKIDTFKEVLKMTFHILQALTYLQEKSCLHGDIRPENIAFFQKENLYKLNEMFVIDRMPKEVNLDYIKGTTSNRLGRARLGIFNWQIATRNSTWLRTCSMTC